MVQSPVIASWILNALPYGRFLSLLQSCMRALSATAFFLAALSGCSDGSDRENAASSEPLPQVKPIITPSDGSSDVPRTSWISLSFREPLPSAATLGAQLDCGAGNERVSTDWVADTLLVINPSQELPAQATCTVSWQHDNSVGSSLFEVAATGAPAVLAYDRDDDTRLTPFPDDVWLVEAEDTATGYKLELPIPNREPGVSALYDALITAAGLVDGFSPVVPMVVPVREPWMPPPYPPLPGNPLTRLPR